jgi:cell division inhibitor SulA/protein ImuA
MTGIKTGFAALDAALPGGGWPVGALTEILAKEQGIGELRLLMPALAQLGRNERRQAWIAPPYTPYPPALITAGINLSYTLFVRPSDIAQTLWATEQMLRSGACSAVLAWSETNDFRALRRLQLAAECGACWGVLFRAAYCADHPSPAALRLRLHVCDDALEVHIHKARGDLRRHSVRLSL